MSLLFAGGLADNGGPTQTIALRDAADNPALGRADPATAPATDQRGVARPAPEGTNPDIGAFELEQSNPEPPPVGTTFIVTTTSDVSADDGVLTLREALALADADNSDRRPDRVRARVQGQTIILGGSQLTVNSDVTIDGGTGVTIDADQASRVLLVQGFGTDVVMRHLTITGGRTTGDYEARRRRHPCRPLHDAGARPLDSQRQQHGGCLRLGRRDRGWRRDADRQHGQRQQHGGCLRRGRRDLAVLT